MGDSKIAVAGEGKPKPAGRPPSEAPAVVGVGVVSDGFVTSHNESPAVTFARLLSMPIGETPVVPRRAVPVASVPRGDDGPRVPYGEWVGAEMREWVKERRGYWAGGVGEGAE